MFIHQHISRYVHRKGTVWIKSPEIARVSHPLESPLSEVYKTTFRTSIASRGRAGGGRFLVAVMRRSGAAQSRGSFASWQQMSEGGDLDGEAGDRAGKLPIRKPVV